jgi:hypothetical protein
MGILYIWFSHIGFQRLYQSILGQITTPLTFKDEPEHINLIIATALLQEEGAGLAQPVGLRDLSRDLVQI